MLVGDIGGTKTQLALALTKQTDAGSTPPELQHIRYYQNDHFESFQSLLSKYLKEIPSASEEEFKDVMALCVAGPVRDNYCALTNRPWTLDASQLSTQFDFKRVFLLNDLVATLQGVLNLPPSDFVWLQEHPIKKTGNHSVISAGTGLGEASAVYSRDNSNSQTQRYIMSPSEGGHKNFAPSSLEEIQLLNFYMKEEQHVSVEWFLSGVGLTRIYRFVQETEFESKDIASTPAEITKAAAQDQKSSPAKAVRLFARMLLSEAGNLALQNWTEDGVTIAGGITPHVIDYLKDPESISAFRQKGKFEKWLGDLPLRACTNILAPVYGAWYHAKEQVKG